MDLPDLTVAIPTYNGARHLADALRGVLAQKGAAFDLLICDDRSDDETVALARSEAGDRVRIEINSERLGLAGNWNRCVALSRTPLVAIFHQDDVMLRGHLAAHRAAFASSPTIGLTASAADVLDNEGQAVPPSIVERGGFGPTDRDFAPGDLVRLLAGSNPLRCSAVTIRADAHRDAGGFDPSYRYVVDWEFWLRVARRWAVAWRAHPSVAIRWHSASETHRFKTGTTDLDETARLLDEVFTREGSHWPDAPRLRRAADHRLARAFLNRAYVALRGGNPSLARHSLRSALALWPGLVGRIVLDPRLAAQFLALAAAPGLASRWLSREVAAPDSSARQG